MRNSICYLGKCVLLFRLWRSLCQPCPCSDEMWPLLRLCYTPLPPICLKLFHLKVLSLSQLNLSEVISCMAALIWQPILFIYFFSPQKQGRGLILEQHSGVKHRLWLILCVWASTICSFFCGSTPHLLICDISHIFVIKYLMLNPNCTPIICPPNQPPNWSLQSISYPNIQIHPSLKISHV